LYHIYYILQGGWSCVPFYFPFALLLCSFCVRALLLRRFEEIAVSARQSEGLWVCCLAACCQPVGKQESHENRGRERAGAYLCEVITQTGAERIFVNSVELEEVNKCLKL